MILGILALLPILLGLNFVFMILDDRKLAKRPVSNRIPDCLRQALEIEKAKKNV